ncbi:RNA directed DNA polymerase (reverse transcriptase) [Echinococcus multilocularis]|uniref:RNA directed DNA polymerase (Reverse transcriptase) n=1 Tax=Echinococcus multilocularis TaxID=6211 RepID=A0A0S4MJL1_ECHMU|nr:RNA directed DNA polymerase (reverse transcriptase) [Echinococcus multilocularis]
MGRTDIFKHKIDTGEAGPIWPPHRRIAPPPLEEENRLVEVMKSQDAKTVTSVFFHQTPVYTSTGISPFKMLTGGEMRVPSDIVLPNTDGSAKHVSEYILRLQKATAHSTAVRLLDLTCAVGQVLIAQKVAVYPRKVHQLANGVGSTGLCLLVIDATLGEAVPTPAKAMKLKYSNRATSIIFTQPQYITTIL